VKYSIPSKEWPAVFEVPEHKGRNMAFKAAAQTDEVSGVVPSTHTLTLEFDAPDLDDDLTPTCATCVWSVPDDETERAWCNSERCFVWRDDPDAPEDCGTYEPTREVQLALLEREREIRELGAAAFTD
jgi:hypothetical protein